MITQVDIVYVGVIKLVEINTNLFHYLFLGHQYALFVDFMISSGETLRHQYMNNYDMATIKAPPSVLQWHRYKILTL